MASEEHIQEALVIGERQAARMLAERELVREERTAALAGAAAALEGPLPTLGSTMMTSAGPTTMGTLVAEGDSWFDYPFNDVLKILEDRHGYDVESVAHRGDAIEEMAYDGGQLDELIRRLEKVHRRGVKVKAILLSGGGNDLGGKQFRMLLNHVDSPIAGLSAGMVDAVIDERIHTAYVTILSAVTKVCKDKLGQPIPILVHGYDFLVPDGRGFLGGFGPLPGPWLEPGFREKGFQDLDQRKKLVVELIDRFNEMLERVVAIGPFSHVRYVNLRNTLSTGNDYKRFWANEIHPNKRGFRRVSRLFAQELSILP